MDEKKALEMYSQGFSCSQTVLSAFADEIGMDYDTCLKAASAFGGGAGRKELCGCVTGALIALGLKYGFFSPGDEDGHANMDSVREEFLSRFEKEFGAIRCGDLLRGDLLPEDERRRLGSEGVLLRLCPGFIAGTCHILEDMLED